MSHPNAAWLPACGLAEVVLAGADSDPPSPSCVLRLLTTRDGKVLTVPRADGRGLDLPMLSSGGGAVEGSLQALMVRVLGRSQPTKLLGYVRNVVTEAPDDYPWPWPDAYFAVWHCEWPADGKTRGVWLDVSEAETQLGDRHWWPLAAHVPGWSR